MRLSGHQVESRLGQLLRADRVVAMMTTLSAPYGLEVVRWRGKLG